MLGNQYFNNKGTVSIIKLTKGLHRKTKHQLCLETLSTKYCFCLNTSFLVWLGKASRLSLWLTFSSPPPSCFHLFTLGTSRRLWCAQACGSSQGRWLCSRNVETWGNLVLRRQIKESWSTLPDLGLNTVIAELLENSSLSRLWGAFHWKRKKTKVSSGGPHTLLFYIFT